MARLEFIENDIGMIERNDTLYLDVKFRDDGSNVDPTGVTVDIEYPCSGSGNASFATTPVTGRWEGHWDVPSSATYGEYTIEYTAVYDGHNYKFRTKFYVLPWDMTQKIRSLTGIKQSNDISDRDLAVIAWNAYLEAKEEVFNRVIDERVKQTCNHYFDGSNKTFYTRNRRVVSDYTTCEESAVFGFYKDNDGDLNDLSVTVSDAANGLVSIEDESGNAIPASQCGVYINYRIHTSSFTDSLFEKAVSYLAAHEVILKFHELDKATLADLDSNRPVILANPNRMEEKYKKTLAKIKFKQFGGLHL